MLCEYRCGSSIDTQGLSGCSPGNTRCFLSACRLQCQRHQPCRGRNYCLCLFISVIFLCVPLYMHIMYCSTHNGASPPPPVYLPWPVPPAPGRSCCPVLPHAAAAGRPLDRNPAGQRRARATGGVRSHRHRVCGEEVVGGWATRRMAWKRFPGGPGGWEGGEALATSVLCARLKSCAWVCAERHSRALMRLNEAARPPCVVFIFCYRTQPIKDDIGDKSVFM